MPLISVIIPAYNAGATILETIQSVRQQTFSDLQIIVVDDGSTDETLEQVSTIRDDRLTILAGGHHGLSAARNRGIEQARGEFISFIDADDLWTPEKLEYQIETLRHRPQAGVAYSWTVFVDQQGRFLFAKERTYYEGNVYSQLLRSCFIASGSNVLLRKSCVQSVGLFDTSLCAAEDWEYWLRVAARWQFAVVPRYQILYRVSSGSMSSDVDTVEQANLIVLNRGLSAAPPDVENRRDECLANLKQYVAFLCLTRTSGPQRTTRAWAKLMDSIRLYPRILLSGKTQRLLWSSLVLRVTSASSAPRIVQSLLRLHGRLMMLVTPELRIAAITDRR